MTGTRSIWPEVSLGEVCEFKYGRSLPESLRAGGHVPVFGSNGQVGSHNEALTSGPTVIIGRKGSCGEVNFSPAPCWPIDTTYYVDGASTEADLQWLSYRLTSLGLNKLNKAAAVPGLNRDDAYRQRLLLPPLPEQRRIAEVLDRAEALRAKRRAALAQLDTLAQSIFHDMFGDPATNPKGWPRRTLGDLILVGPQNGVYKPADDYGTGTPILRIDAFYDGAVTKLATLKRVRLSSQEQERYALREGEIVINRVNSPEYLGKSALIPSLNEITVFESNMMRFDVDCDILDPGYLIEYLQTRFVRAHILRSAKDAVNQSSINQQDVVAIPLVVPPIASQRIFVQRIAARERLKGSLVASNVRFDALFASLQHRAFRGEL